MAEYKRFVRDGKVYYADECEFLNSGQPWALKVTQGLIPHHSWVDKFGENPEIDPGTQPEDIWEYGGIYPYDPINTAPIVSLVSDSVLDTQVISVQGLDIKHLPDLADFHRHLPACHTHYPCNVIHMELARNC